jgi:hypothetical protein
MPAPEFFDTNLLVYACDPSDLYRFVRTSYSSFEVGFFDSFLRDDVTRECYPVHLNLKILRCTAAYPRPFTLAPYCASRSRLESRSVRFAAANGALAAIVPGPSQHAGCC